MTATSIAVLEGDGIGPEITEATVSVTKAAAKQADLNLDFVSAEVGWKPYRSSGTTMPDATIRILDECAGWIVGPTAAGEYPKDDPVRGHPSGFMRRHYQLFGNVRPVRAWPQVEAIVRDINTTVIRENTEGFYPDRNLYWGYGEFLPTSDVALSLRVITRAACDRLARLSYDLAKAKGLSSFVVVHKRTALPQTDGLFVAAFEDLADEYPDITVEYVRIDTFSSMLPREPGRFQLVATTNLFGDIISDQAAGLVGGIGLAPSLNVGIDHAMAQAVHGTAADIAGRGIANPSALMLSAASLLEWLGTRSGDHKFVQAGRLFEQAVGSVLGSSVRTGDLGGSASTSEFAKAVIEAIDAR